MKKVLFAIVVACMAFSAFGQLTQDRVLKAKDGGQEKIIYEFKQGDAIVGIPIKNSFIAKNSNFVNSGDNGKNSTDNIAVAVYYQHDVVGQTYHVFVPYKFTPDTLWVAIPAALKSTLVETSNNFTGNIANPARVEIWCDAKIKGNLTIKHPYADGGWKYAGIVYLHSIVTGYTDFPGNQVKANQLIAGQFANAFQGNGIAKVISYFPLGGQDISSPIY